MGRDLIAALCKSRHQATSGQVPEVPDSFSQFVQTALIGIAHLRLLAAGAEQEVPSLLVPSACPPYRSPQDDMFPA